MYKSPNLEYYSEHKKKAEKQLSRNDFEGALKSTDLGLCSLDTNVLHFYRGAALTGLQRFKEAINEGVIILERTPLYSVSDLICGYFLLGSNCLFLRDLNSGKRYLECLFDAWDMRHLMKAVIAPSTPIDNIDLRIEANDLGYVKLAQDLYSRYHL